MLSLILNKFLNLQWGICHMSANQSETRRYCLSKCMAWHSTGGWVSSVALRGPSYSCISNIKQYPWPTCSETEMSVKADDLL